MYRKIQEKCKEKGKTISEVESALGFPRGSIYKWDAHRPSVDKVKALADYLGCAIEDLVG